MNHLLENELPPGLDFETVGEQLAGAAHGGFINIGDYALIPSHGWPMGVNKTTFEQSAFGGMLKQFMLCVANPSGEGVLTANVYPSADGFNNAMTALGLTPGTDTYMYQQFRPDDTTAAGNILPTDYARLVTDGIVPLQTSHDYTLRDHPIGFSAQQSELYLAVKAIDKHSVRVARALDLVSAALSDYCRETTPVDPESFEPVVVRNIKRLFRWSGERVSTKAAHGVITECVKNYGELSKRGAELLLEAA